jgi:hypothetical protein
VLGLIAAALSLVPVVGLVLGTAAAILGSIVLKKSGMKARAIIGILAGSLAIMVNIVAILVIITTGHAATNTSKGSAHQQSFEQAKALIEQVPGIKNVVVSSHIKDTPWNHETSIVAYVDDPAVVQTPAIVTFLFAAGWATTSGNSPDVVSIIVIQSHAPVATKPGTVVLQTAIDLTAQAKSAFNGNAEPYHTQGEVSATEVKSVLTTKFGAYPGPIPTVPAP